MTFDIAEQGGELVATNENDLHMTSDFTLQENRSSGEATPTKAPPSPIVESEEPLMADEGEDSAKVSEHIGQQGEVFIVKLCVQMNGISHFIGYFVQSVYKVFLCCSGCDQALLFVLFFRLPRGCPRRLLS